MSTIRLRNTMTGAVEEFTPIDASNVRMYVCGPTVYDRAHLGNARPAVVFDTLYRLLRHVYGDDHVVYVRNITDIDDKINARAAETGRRIREITDETAAWYAEDMAAVGNLAPTHAPRATDYVPRMVAMIEDLIKKGHAYESAGHALFAVDSWWEHYGKLSGRSVEDMTALARVEAASYKRNPMDFVLWKPSGDDLPGWDSPWGRGRPGWHIECSAMALDLLGGSFDIHGGGNDLIFPHHENEIAQSRCAHPDAEFARVWVHNEMLLIEGRKMAKSLGNFVTVRDLLDRGVPGEVIRFVMLSTHYGKPMDWTEKKRLDAEAVLRKWRELVDGAVPAAPDPAVVAALSDDLNTAGAIARLHRLAAEGRAEALAGSAALLGLLGGNLGGWETAGAFGYGGILLETPALSYGDFGIETLEMIVRFQSLAAEGLKEALVGSAALLGLLGGNLGGWETAEASGYEDLIRDLIAKRAEARRSKDFARADAIRDALAVAGVTVHDMAEGTVWEIGPEFNADKLEEER